MTNIYNWSLTAGDNATADSGINWAEGQLPSTVNDSARVMMERIAEYVKDHGALTLSGTDTLTVTANSAFSAYATGQSIVAKVANDNTGAATLNVNSIGAKAVRKVTQSGEVALAAGDLQAGQFAYFVYDTAANSAAGAWILMNPAAATLTIGTDVQAWDEGLDELAAVSSADGNFIVGSASGWVAESGATARTSLGLGTAAVENYTEDTWTPTVSFATPGTSSFSYATQTGRYIRIGNLVWISVSLDFTPTIGTASGSFQISLPSLTAAYDAAFSVFRSSGGWNISASYFIPVVAASGTVILIRSQPSAASSGLVQTGQLTGGASHVIAFSGFFEVT